MSEKNKEKKSVLTKRSEAGKGDKIRRGISIDEWGKRWEAIFRTKKKKPVRSHKSSNSGSES